MELKRVKELMEIEKECITRSDTCNRDCARCELVQDDIELKEAYSSIIQLIEHEIQSHDINNKPKADDHIDNLNKRRYE